MPKPIDTGANDTPVFTGQVGGPAPSSQTLSPSIAGAAYEGLGKMAEQLSDISEKALIPQMEDRGSQAVTRDPGTGELSVHTRIPLNNLDVAYNHAAQAAFLTQSEGDRRSYLQQLAIDHLDDPAKFNELATKYVKTQAGGAGVPSGLRTDILNTGSQDVSQFTQNITAKKESRDTKNQFDAINSGIKSTSNDIYALAHQGGTGTDDFKLAVAKLNNQLNTLGNPVFGMSPSEIEDRKSQILSSAEGEVVLGQAVGEAKTKGADSGLAFLQQAIWGPQLNLTPAQRETFEHRGTAQIHQLEAGNRAAGVQLKQEVEQRLDDAYSKAGATGRWDDVVTPDEIAQAYKDNPAKGSDIISRLNGAATTFSMNQQLAHATPADVVDMEKRFNPANSPTTKAGYDAFYSGFLTGHEKGYAAHDGSALSGPVNMGVNQDANPDLDVKNLTPDQAKQVLHDRYWVASGADALPPQLAAVVGDTAINMGVGKSKELLAQSGGDPGKFLDMRADAYKAIAKANPDKAANLPTWLARNEDLRNFISGGGFADKQRTYVAFQEALHRRNTALAADPAGYTAGVRSDISAMLQSEDLGTFQTGLRNSLQAQRDFGVVAPRVLSEGQAKGLVQSFNNPQNPEKRADNMLQIIGGMEERYGKFFPQAMSELQKAGMPSEAVILAQVKNDPAVAVRMTNAINTGRTNLRKITPGAEDIDKSVASGLAAFNKTLAGQTGNSKVAAQQTEAAQLYAYQLAQEGVANPGQRAAQDIINKRYAFVDSYRVPNGIDAHEVEFGASQLLSDLPASAIMPEQSLADPRITPETRQTLSSQILHGRGVWLTKPDDSGLYLAYPQETGFVPGRLVNGKTINFSWAQITAKAAAASPTKRLHNEPYIQ